jgi:ABC-2 type transport system permease protein
MSWKKIFAVIRREYIERVRTKAFWIGTLLVPIFFLGYIAIQIASFKKTGGDRTVAVIDQTGTSSLPAERPRRARGRQPKERPQPGSPLEPPGAAVTGSLEATKEALRNEVLKKKLDGYLVLDPALIEKSSVGYYAITVSEFVAMGQLERALNHVA